MLMLFKALQSFLFYPKEWGVDLCSASAHKFRGPKGVGFLYRREGVQLKPLLVGGGQENGIRSGTENVPLIVGMAKALRLSIDNLTAKTEHKYRLRRLIVEGISSIPELTLTGSEQEEEMAPHIVHFAFAGMKAEVVVHALEQQANLHFNEICLCLRGVRPEQGHASVGLQSRTELLAD